jgi:hypothetical protein
VRSSPPHIDLTQLRRVVKHVDVVMKNYYNKRAKSQIFVDVAQEGVNHGNICVM